MSTDRILARVARIPIGYVASYGDVWPPAPRLTGRTLRLHGHEVGWWRVVHADGTVVKGERQLSRLRDEGVPLRGARVDMRRARVPAEVLDT